MQIFPQQQINISGTLLDANGSPVKDAIITAFYGPPFVLDHVTISDKPLDDGFFGIVKRWKPGTKIWVLIEERPDGFYPLGDLALLNPKVFKGIVIDKFSKDIYLGNVRKYVQYGKAVIDISRLSERTIRKIRNHKIIASIHDESGGVADNSSFAKAVTKDGKQAVFNLPEGCWFIEFVDTSDNNAIVMSKQKFVVTLVK